MANRAAAVNYPPLAFATHMAAVLAVARPVLRTSGLNGESVVNRILRVGLKKVHLVPLSNLINNLYYWYKYSIVIIASQGFSSQF